MPRTLSLRRATLADADALQAIREAAFAPVFASFRSILGEEIYERAQRAEDDAQGPLLDSLFEPDSGWDVYCALAGAESAEVVGFVTLQMNAETLVGEIGLNAVHPAHAGKGYGTRMYELALELMRDAGMKVATVATGGDPSHAAARRAYVKAGFDVEIPSVWYCKAL